MNRKHLVVLAQALASVAMLAVLFRGLDYEAFVAQFRRLPVWFYLISLLVVLGGQVLYAWRWKLVLVASGVNVRVGVVLRQYFIGVFLNNFFPSTMGGDVAKIYYLGRDHGYRPLAASVFLDRLLGLGLLSLIATFGQWTSPVTSPRLAAVRALVTGVTAAALGVLLLAVRGTGGLPRRVARLGPRFVSLASHVQQFRLDMASAAAQPAILAKAFAVVLTYFCALTVIYQLFIQLSAPAAPTFLSLLTVVTTTAVLSNIPVSLNGLGLREQLHVLLLQPLGVPRELAVAISLLLYAHLLVASLCGLVLWMRSPAIPADAGEQVLV